MKKSLLALVAVLMSLVAMAQAPQKMTYQAVVRDNNGQLVSNGNVGVRITIVRGSETGTGVYSQTETVRTNDNGLFTTMIGGTGFDAIDWGNGPYYLKSEVDPDGGSNYILTTTQQMVSVPYALHAGTVDSIIGGVNITETDPVFAAWDKDYNDLINRPTIPTGVSELNNDAGYLTSYTETQTLANVATLGNAVNNQIKQLADPTEILDAVNLQTLNTTIESAMAIWTGRFDSLVHVYDSIIGVQTRIIDSLEDVVSNISPTPQTTGGFDTNGASYATFTVAEGRTVRFSKGNLQYTTTGTHAVNGGGTAVGTWRFAEHQYDYIGSANSNISSSNAGWIDLFGWGTSGWNSGANYYQPWSTSTSYSDYYPGGSHTNNLTDTYANADWGVYNAISNGGNQAGVWRTLTSDEWDYLLNSRAASTTCGYGNVRYVIATVNDVTGLIIFPDTYTHPIGLATLRNVNTEPSEFSGYVVTLSEWQQIESAGAIFLPTAGHRNGTETSLVSKRGVYWSSTYNSEMSAKALSIDSYGGDNTTLNIINYTRRYGNSVRLVKDAQ